MTTLLTVMIIVCALWAVAASLMIANYLQKRGVWIRWLWIRVLTLEYVEEYRKRTVEERGRPGSLFYHYIGGVGGAIVFAGLLLVAKILGVD